MKYLIVGLGNIGPEYEYTRHNIGFDVVNALAKQENIQFRSETHGSIAEFKHKGKMIYLLKPSTYMNLSGKAVKYWMTKLKIDKENVLIVVDDIHLDLGATRMRDKGSDGGHNGLKDINAELGTTQFNRLRVGVGKDFRPGQQVNYVLGKWKQSESEQVEEMILKSTKIILDFVSIGFKYTLEKLSKSNSKI
ncbi:MAG: aminoacyl-tRNA hydrolase [Saprospiraceae bacterium]